MPSLANNRRPIAGINSGLLTITSSRSSTMRGRSHAVQVFVCLETYCCLLTLFNRALDSPTRPLHVCTSMSWQSRSKLAVTYVAGFLTSMPLRGCEAIDFCPQSRSQYELHLLPLPRPVWLFDNLMSFDLHLALNGCL